MGSVKTWKTKAVKPAEVERRWLLVDASGTPLGRVASRVAALVRGKHKPAFSPHVDCGDFVVVINAAKVTLTGTKADSKMYYRHSGYPGGLKEQRAGDLRARNPVNLVRRAVRGMLPKNTLGRTTLHKLKVYAGPNHPHQVQSPVPVEIRR